jgi:hypothetical protein
MNDVWIDVIQNRQPEHSPIFIVGVPRSGTSLLGRIVGLSPDVSIFEETGLFSLVYARRYPFRAYAHQKQRGTSTINPLGATAANLSDHLRSIDRLRNLLRRMLEYTRVRGYDLRPSNGLSDTQNIELDAGDEELIDVLYGKYQSLTGSDFGGALRVLLRDFRLLAQTPRIAEKTPTHFLYLASIFHYFPDARVVFISRDARDVLASYVGTFSHLHISWKRAARHIHRLCDKASAVAKSYGDDRRVLYVDYQELVSETLATVGRVYEFVGVSPAADTDTKLADVGKTTSQAASLPEAQKRYIEALLKRTPLRG